MAGFLFDTSAIVKRYVQEVGTAWVTGLVDPAAGHGVYLARITAVEVVSAITRRQRGGSFSAATAAGILAAFHRDLAISYRCLDITPALIAHAMALAETHALRGYDAVQLAAAFVARSDCTAQGLSFTLVSADAELNAAATAEGLVVDDPNRHP